MSDYSDTVKVQKRLMQATRELHELVVPVALARQVKEFSGERRKALLAIFAAKLIQNGQSSAAAETIARADVTYLQELATLEGQYKDACATIAKWDATFASFEAARSLNSTNKERMRNIPE